MRIRILTAVLLCISALLSAQNLITTYSVAQGLPQGGVTDLYRDNESYLWCGTAAGLRVYDGWEFHQPSTNVEKSNPNLNAPVMGIVPSADQRTIWIGAGEVIMQFDRFSFHVKSSFDVVKQADVREVPVYANDTAVWVACTGAGLYRVRTSDGNATALTSSGYIFGTAVYLSSTNQVCFADSTDHLVFAGLKSSAASVVPLPAGLHSRAINRLVAFPGIDNSMLVLTGNGMWQYDSSPGQFRRVKVGGELFNDTLSDFADMTEHVNGEWWFAIRQRGVFAFNRAEFRTTVIAEENVNGFVTPSRLICDDYGVMWGAGEQGLTKMLHARYDSGGALLCYRSPLILASYVNEDDGRTGIISESIIRDYSSRDVALHVWQTDFAFPEQAVFNYKLEGREEQMQSAAGIYELKYEGLASGFYSLICNVTAPGCGQTSITKLLTIKIVPPFWTSGWFIGIFSMAVVLLITIVLFIVMRMKYQRKLRKLKMHQELDKVRARISRDIHDEIGAGLTRIALSGELLSQKAAADVQQQEKLKWIAGTARELSQSMKEVVWSVNPHYDSLDHMVAYFRSYVAGVAEHADVRFRYESEDNLPAEQVNPETRRNLLLILKEAVSNSVKYSACTELKLEIRWKNETFTMKISDNGNGFDVNGKEGVNSNGLRNIRQRAGASNCTVEIDSAIGKGTTTTVVGPVA